MDTKLLISEVKARFGHNASKEYLRDKYTSKLIIADQGGLWKATPELLTFLATTFSKTLVIVDDFGNPVKVNRVELLVKLTDVYNSVMEEWHNEWTELEKKR